jgi:arylsulfatase A-like enzyme
VRLDQDLGKLFAHLDAKVGKGNYVVALSADHGVAPIPEQMEKTGADAGVLRLAAIHEAAEKALEQFNYPKPAVARVSSADVYFAPGIYARLKEDRPAMQSVIAGIRAVPGVLEVYRDDELSGRPATGSPARSAESLSYFPERSGDLLIVPKPYWLLDWTPLPAQRAYGTGHGTPYNYDQHVPLFLMGWGIQPGEYYAAATPADIAPTLAALCGITLSPRDGRILADAFSKPRTARTSAGASATSRKP